MTFPTNSSVIDFDGQVTVTVAGGTASLAADAFSVVGDVVAGNYTNSLNAEQASMVIFFDWNTTPPDANSSVNLYARLMDIDGTGDQDIPDANFQQEYLGSFATNNVITNQFKALRIALPNAGDSQVYQFYIENKTGETIIAGWTLKIDPAALTPSL